MSARAASKAGEEVRRRKLAGAFGAADDDVKARHTYVVHVVDVSGFDPSATDVSITVSLATPGAGSS